MLGHSKHPTRAAVWEMLTDSPQCGTCSFIIIIIIYCSCQWSECYMIHLVIVELTSVITMAYLKWGSVFIILVKIAYGNSECHARSSMKCQDGGGGDLGALAVTSGHSHETFTLCSLTRVLLHLREAHTSQALAEPTHFPPSDSHSHSQPRSPTSRTYDPRSHHQTCEPFRRQRSF